MATLAAKLVKALAPRWLSQGSLVAGALALAGLSGGMIAAAMGAVTIGLAFAAAGAFIAEIAAAYSVLSARLRREDVATKRLTLLRGVVDALAALVLWFALAPWPQWAPLAVCGVLAIGLARLATQTDVGSPVRAAGEQTVLLATFALAAGFGVLPEATALVALGLLAALLLHKRAN